MGEQPWQLSLATIEYLTNRAKGNEPFSSRSFIATAFL
jgi:hypothetical protein